MRTPDALLKARARKVPALADLVDRMAHLSDTEIEQAPIKASDRKLLRKSIPHARRTAELTDMVKSMPTHDVEPQRFDVYVYQGDDTTYSSFEVPHGTIITFTDQWVRFDHYRMKRTGGIDQLLAQCNLNGSMELDELNRFITESICQRHGVPIAPEEESAPGPKGQLRITSADILGR